MVAAHLIGFAGCEPRVAEVTPAPPRPAPPPVVAPAPVEYTAKVVGIIDGMSDKAGQFVEALRFEKDAIHVVIAARLELIEAITMLDALDDDEGDDCCSDEPAREEG